MTLLDLKIEEIKRLCINYNVSKLFAFGSVLNNSFNDQSDIDFIVDFDIITIENYADNYFNLKTELEAILNRPIDLIEEQAIRNPYFRSEVDKEKQLIYG